MTLHSRQSEYAGTTKVLDGSVLTLPHAKAAGESTIDIDAGGVLKADFNGSLANNLEGGGTLNVLKNLVLLRDTDFTGLTRVDSGASLTLMHAGGVDGDIANSGSLLFDTQADGAFTHQISGSGEFEKTGTGTLTLTATNTHTGGTKIAGGTLALSGVGSIAESSGLSMAAGTTFDLTNLAGSIANVKTLTVAGTGSSVTGASNNKRLTVDNNSPTFDLTGVGDTDVMLDASGTMTTDASTVIDLAITGAVKLQKGDAVTLVKNLGTGSTFTNVTNYSLGRHLFDITLNVSEIVLASNGNIPFREYSDGIFGPAGLNNANIMSGSDYLDQLDAASDPFIATLGDAYDAAAIGRPPQVAAVAVQQLFGSYAAYANQALADDASRFRRRWQAWNRQFFDARLFSDLLTGTANAGFASESGLASLPYGPRDNIAAGQSRVWGGGFGTWAKQDMKANLPGYKYDSQGAVLGYEYSIGSLNLGFAAGYSRGDLKVNDLRYKNETDVMNLALYGAYIHESGLYAEGGLGYGHAWNDYKVNSTVHPGGVKKGKYGSDAFTADLELGYIARLHRGVNLIPSVGVEYTYLKNGTWTENINNPALVANRFASGHDNGVDIPLGLRLNKMFRFGCDGGFVVPEVRASYVYSANKSRPSITAGYAGAPGGAKMVGVEPGRSHWRIGAGVSGRINGRVDFRLDYDFETRSGFKGHNLNASVGLSF